MVEAECVIPLENALSEGAAAVDEVLDQVLTSPEGPESRVFEAMRYSSLGNGEAITPVLGPGGGAVVWFP